MVFKIGLNDLFYGFIRNYYTFGIRAAPKRSKQTKWTNMILGFFAKLGQDFGFFVEYEWNRYDLTWFYDLDSREAGKPYLHIEHENVANRLGELMTKMRNSVSDHGIAIGYPADKPASRRFISRIKTFHKNLKDGKEMMFILDPVYYASDDEILGLVAKAGRKTLDWFDAKRYEAADGTFYTSWVDLKDDGKQEED